MYWPEVGSALPDAQDIDAAMATGMLIPNVRARMLTQARRAPCNGKTFMTDFPRNPKKG
jgi:hypothetical protein